jgi:hypothetical protein
MPNAPYLQFQQGSPSFESLTGLAVVPSGFTVLYVDRLFHVWSQQIDDYTGTTFEPLKTKKIITYAESKYSYISIGTWQKTINLVIKRGQNILTPEVDFDYALSSDKQCVIGLKMNTGSCFNGDLTIEGTYGWQPGITFDVESLLLESMIKVLSTNRSIGQTAKVKTSEGSKNSKATFFVDEVSFLTGAKLLSGTPIYDIPEATCLSKYRAQAKPILTAIKNEFDCV